MKNLYIQNSKPMKRILVATDFSKGAENAAKLAEKLAFVYSAEIHLLHCYSSTYIDAGIPSTVIIDQETEHMKSLEEKLKKAAREIQERGVRTSYELTQNGLKDAISSLVEEKEIDFLVIGKTGETGFLEKILGHNAAYLVNNVAIPMLVVPENHKEIKKLVYSTQLEFSEKEPLKSFFGLAYRLKIPVELIHVDTDQQLDLTDDSQLVQEMKKDFPMQNIKIKNLRSNRLVETLLAEAGDNAILALTTHDRGFLDGILNPSTSKKVVGECEIPVLIYRF